MLNIAASGLTAPTQSAAGIAAATAAPAVSYEIGQYFKALAAANLDGKLSAGQQTAHIVAHGILGATVAAAGVKTADTVSGCLNVKCRLGKPACNWQANAGNPFPNPKAA